ncbi:MAG: class I SAM-dependent methyltransferase [Bacteroidota bacterium]
MSKLREILDQNNINGWDKEGGTDKDTIHAYLESYEKYFSPYIDKECSLLEIGVMNGGSSLLWHEFLPKAKICGVDIRWQIPDSLMVKFSNRYRFKELNAYTNECVEAIKQDYPDGFDIIVEDGIHTKESNAFSIKHYLPMLKSGGVMIIEDVPANPLNETPFSYTGITLPHVIEEMKDLIPEEYEVEVLDLVNIKGRFDDILFIIKKS